VGGYAGESDTGIYQCTLDTRDGGLGRIADERVGAKPTFLALHPSASVLYAVNGVESGAVGAYQVDSGSGKLSLLGKQLSRGNNPCHISCDRTGRLLAAANYVSGTLSLFRIGSDFALEPASQVIQHQGHGPDPERQSGPHAHYAGFDPSNRFLLCCDLGIDRVLVYRIQETDAKLVLHSEAKLADGAGPRHLCFHPNGRWAYVINELDPSVTICAWDTVAGTLTMLQTVTVCYGDGREPQSGAEICVHPEGRFVYASVRGRDSIVVYSIDDVSGALTYLGHTGCGGRSPRHFAIEPDGRYLLAANQSSDSVVSFALDCASGTLRQVAAIGVPKPACVVFA
jgi:6-phosphogluconolactonase